MPEQPKCEKCGGPLDWRGRCITCASLERLRGTIQNQGGFNRKERRERKTEKKPATPKTWNGPSGVDSAVPNGDKD